MQSLHDLLMHRRSYRKYTEQPLTAEEKHCILEAALMSPAGKRRNPWHFIAVDDRATLQQLATAKESGAAPIATAAFAIVLAARPEDSDTWIEDLSIAATFIQLQCTDLGLGSCWIQMRERNDADGTPATTNIQRILGMPEDYQVLCVLSIGHPDEERKPYDPEKLQWEKVHQGQF